MDVERFENRLTTDMHQQGYDQAMVNNVTVKISALLIYVIRMKIISPPLTIIQTATIGKPALEFFSPYNNILYDIMHIPYQSTRPNFKC